MKVRIFTGRNPQKVEEEINKFSEEHDGKCPMTTALDSDGFMVYTGFYWYDEVKEVVEVKPVALSDGNIQIDMNTWKFFPDKKKYWTRHQETKVEQSVAPKPNGVYYYLIKDAGTQHWGDVVSLDAEKKIVIVKMRGL